MVCGLLSAVCGLVIVQTVYPYVYMYMYIFAPLRQTARTHRVVGHTSFLRGTWCGSAFLELVTIISWAGGAGLFCVSSSLLGLLGGGELGCVWMLFALGETGVLGWEGGWNCGREIVVDNA